MASVNESHFSVAEVQPVFRAFIGLTGPASKFPWERGVTQIRIWMGSVDVVAFASFCFSRKIDSREARAAVIANETKKRKTHTYFEFLTPGEYIG